MDRLFLMALTFGVVAVGADAGMTDPSCPHHGSSAEVLTFPMGFARFRPGRDATVAVPQEYLRPWVRARLARDGGDGAISLFVELPDLAPLYDGADLRAEVPEDDRGRILVEPGMDLAEQLAIAVGADAADRAVREGDMDDAEPARWQGLRPVPGALMGQELVAVEGGAVILLANCQDGRVPICTARATSGDLTAQVVFRQDHLADWRTLHTRAVGLLDCLAAPPR